MIRYALRYDRMCMGGQCSLYSATPSPARAAAVHTPGEKGKEAGAQSGMLQAYLLHFGVARHSFAAQFVVVAMRSVCKMQFVKAR